MTYEIRLSEPQDFSHFGAIEKAAGSLFIDAGLAEIASHEPTDTEFVEAAARARSRLRRNGRRRAHRLHSLRAL